jgi:hypothetical protein
MRISRFWILVIASLVATPFLLLLGFASTGAGHGDYILATLLFPYSALLVFGLGELIPTFIIAALAVFQFPAYGIILGIAIEKKQFRSRAIILLIVHIGGVIAGLLLRNRFL